MTTLKNLTIYLENEIIKDGYITFDRHIIEIGQGDCDGIDMAGKLLIPGFIDQHIHGAYGSDVMDALEHSLETMSQSLPLEGTTSYFATTMTETSDGIKNALASVKTYIETNQKPGAELLGVHLEGPFISKTYKGAQRLDAISDPSISLFDMYNKASGYNIKQVTLAPETKDALPLIKHLNQLNIVASIGHSDASYDVTQEAITAGASLFTHGYNAMRPLHHRDLGVVGAMLLHEETYAELICDFVHTSKPAAKLLYKNKGKDRLILITDAMRAKGLKDGVYNLGGQHVIKKGLEARLEDGTLAGSVLKMDDAVKNFKTLTNASIETIIAVASANPAKLHRIFDRKGSIAVGKDADFIIIDEDINIYETYCLGIRCY
ncbi:MAG: N-acetylglucosamine-6-phosphate deacetylase [Acholeplasmataceae bacterium]